MSESESSCCNCCSGGCCCCKGEAVSVLPEHLQNGNIFNNRSCTDCCMVPLYIIMFIGWLVLLIVASQFGHPERLLYPSNFRGSTCGNPDDANLADKPVYWAPLPSYPSYGYCEASCPQMGDVACNNDIEPLVEDASISKPNTYYNHNAAEFAAGSAAAAACVGSCTADQSAKATRWVGLQYRMAESKCFLSVYSSQPSVYRCTPISGLVNWDLLESQGASNSTVSKMDDTLGVSSFFQLGFGEMHQCWRVILIVACTAFGVSFVWVLLLRWILAPLVYGCILLILAVFIGVGFAAKYLADNLDSLHLPGASGTNNQQTLYRVVEYVAWIIACIYVVVMLFLINRIRIAIAVMKEASRAFTSAPSLVFVPPIVFLVAIGWVAFFIATTVYIQTIGTDVSLSLAQNATENFIGVTAHDVSAYVAAHSATYSAYSQSNATYNMTALEETVGVKWLHAYNFFMILWTGNFCIMLGFMVMVMVVCSWYFSATQVEMRAAESSDAAVREHGKEKSTIPFVVPRAACTTLRYHLGTVLWGALLIAIIQFIRALFLYLQETVLKDAKNSQTGRVVLCIINYCLWYIEQIIRIISKNAFIITAIKCTGFCSSAFEAIGLLVSNGLRFGILLSLSTAVMFVVKCFIVGCNILIAFALMKVNSLTDDRPVQSGLFPYFGMVLLSFIVASLFLNVYESCIDTIFMCFLIDEKEYKGTFMPESLADLVGLFASAEQARQAYESALNTATTKALRLEPKREDAKA